MLITVPIKKDKLCLLFLILSVVSFISCAPSVPLYSSRAYEQAVSLKVASLAVMDKAAEPYADHEQGINSLNMRLQEAYEYAKGRPNNDYSTKQWQIMLDPQRNLLGGFLKHWQGESVLSGTFIEEAKGLVSDAFDTIISLESGKIYPKGLDND